MLRNSTIGETKSIRILPKQGRAGRDIKPTTILLTSTKWYKKKSILPRRIPPDSSLSAALLLLFCNEKKFTNQKMSRFRVPIPQLQNLAVLLSMSYVAKFCRVQDFRLCSTTPPYAETAIASLRQSGICRTMSPSM